MKVDNVARARDSSKIWARWILGGAGALLILASFLSVAQITESPLPQPNSRPVGITLGPNGNIWLPGQVANQIGRLTPGTVDFILDVVGYFD